ncbi:polysaccharide pyruvyl transferase family protein [Amycolatopsis pithecellobii]|uniref:Polysaccharide pyruvyl transferase family protein n=1 Tax=Amycolatopsis pithecellobii TaxID=664692 RepID=A0A6N7Z1G5_9PSEU|nr:polysaccharide pyruvyl transferase family protein [Amycolatopsis pithecellobii]MTD53384.1 polysaccharide pyruvyl transferase family protein [Amycolatopsis pithecellobii]
MRVLVTGWPSFYDGEATAGDVLSMRRVCDALNVAGVAHDSAWSPAFRPGGMSLDDAEPGDYTHVVFVCGPAHGKQVRRLHERYAGCRRIAVGVSVLDASDPAVTGFHRVFARDGDTEPAVDLSATANANTAPVAGVVFAPGQPEYGVFRRHDEVHARLTTWLCHLDCARIPVDTRLAIGDWSKCATPDQFLALAHKFDVIVTTRLHGLVLGLRASVPVLAVDPIEGGGKVTAQADALGWPALVGAHDVGHRALLDNWWQWCLSIGGRVAARRVETDSTLIDDLLLEMVR